MKDSTVETCYKIFVAIVVAIVIGCLMFTCFFMKDVQKSNVTADQQTFSWRLRRTAIDDTLANRIAAQTRLATAQYARTDSLLHEVNARCDSFRAELIQVRHALKIWKGTNK